MKQRSAKKTPSGRAIELGLGPVGCAQHGAGVTGTVQSEMQARIVKALEHLLLEVDQIDGLAAHDELAVVEEAFAGHDARGDRDAHIAHAVQWPVVEHGVEHERVIGIDPVAPDPVGGREEFG